MIEVIATEEFLSSFSFFSFGIVLLALFLFLLQGGR